MVEMFGARHTCHGPQGVPRRRTHASQATVQSKESSLSFWFVHSDLRVTYLVAGSASGLDLFRVMSLAEYSTVLDTVGEIHK